MKNKNNNKHVVLGLLNKMIKSINKYGLSTLNAWKIQLLNQEKFIVTPAHNIIYKPKEVNNFIASSFLPTKYATNWYVPKKYIQSPKYDLLNDLAFMPLDNNSSAIKSNYIDLNAMYKIKYYYYQPYDFNNVKLQIEKYQLGCGENIIYNCPNTECFEGINFGFRGMSGAAITNTKSDKFIGLFIRKISNLGTNNIDSTLETEMIGVSRGFVMPIKYIENIIYHGDNIKIL